MTNEDLKRFYQLNSTLNMNTDFVRYDTAGNIQCNNPVNPKDVVNLQTLNAEVGKDALGTVNYKGKWISGDEIYTNDIAYVDNDECRIFYIALSDIASSTLSPLNDNTNWKELFEVVIAGQSLDLSVPAQTSSGLLTEAQLAFLQNSDNNYINLNDELYYLADKQDVSGYRVYSHAGQDNTNNFFIKCLTITLSTLGWTLTSIQLSSQV